MDYETDSGVPALDPFKVIGYLALFLVASAVAVFALDGYIHQPTRDYSIPEPTPAVERSLLVK